MESENRRPRDIKSLNAVAKAEYYRIMNSQMWKLPNEDFADAVEGLTYELYGSQISASIGVEPELDFDAIMPFAQIRKGNAETQYRVL